jgi:hypothetical protein
MPLTSQNIIDEVSRLAGSANPQTMRRLDTTAHLVAVISLLAEASSSSAGGLTGSQLDASNLAADVHAILLELVNSKALEEQWVQDSSPTPVKMLRRVTVDQSTGVLSVSFVDGSPAQNPVTPVLPVSPIGISRAPLTPVTYRLNGGLIDLTGYLDELAIPTALYSDLLRQSPVTIGGGATEAASSSINAFVSAATAGAVIAVERVNIAQNKTAAAFTLPAINSNVAVTISPIAGHPATNTLYQVNDIVLTSQPDTRGFATKSAKFSVVSVAGNTVTLRLLSADAAAIGSPVFAIGAELTGQSRLPNIPVNATMAFVTPVMSIASRSASLNPSSTMNTVAQGLTAGDPLVYWGLKTAAGIDIDLESRYGAELGCGGYWGSENKTDLARWRCFCVTPLELQPSIEVVYR